MWRASMYPMREPNCGSWNSTFTHSLFSSSTRSRVPAAAVRSGTRLASGSRKMGAGAFTTAS
jgi:hypothetical protein